MKQITREAGDRKELVLDITNEETKLPFDGSSHAWKLRVRTLANYLINSAVFVFSEISGTYTYSAGVSGYVSFPVSSANSALLLAGEEYVFEVWYNEAGTSPSKPVFVEKFQCKMQP